MHYIQLTASLVNNDNVVYVGSGKFSYNRA